ncbi:MAG: bifunctional hydroxymethylpyrimidine kinase/phosphomethylpyrimidine kinase [Cyanobacteriota bacterium]|nr:bifunctional hydroxymethylpyrimidine kinase/phosphomethylpyrimidine kinase [Cyanobacteriota bacterium]
MAEYSHSKIPIALTIAGSDSGGGAGIQADLRTFAFHRVHGTSAITCVTAQNTLGVNRVDLLSPDAVVAQIEAVATDIGIDAAKTGMLSNSEMIIAVSRIIKGLTGLPVVVDPVMVSRTGAQLIDDRAVKTLREVLIPQAAIVTPNRYEAQILSGMEIHDLEEMRSAAKRIYDLGAAAVLVKGGGMGGKLCGVDVWYDGDRCETLATETIDTPHTHGTGCTLSAAIAANLALDRDLLDSVKRAKQYLTQALKHSLAIGGGQGPVGHFYPLIEANPAERDSN